MNLFITKINIFILASFVATTLLANDNYYASLDSVSLKSLSEIKVYTSNRYLTREDEASSITTVITSEQISKRGYKTLDELLSKVVGFFPAQSSKRANISNRGFKQEINSNYLILIDGHRLNESAYLGAGEYQIFPILDNVKRVEVIRSSATTLWGGDALNGIISIITKDGADIDGFYANADYEALNKREIINIGYGKKFDELELFFSLGYFKNKAQTTIYEAPQREFDWQGNQTGVYTEKTKKNDLLFEPSYTSYLKLNYKDFGIKAKWDKFVHGSGGWSDVDVFLEHTGEAIREDRYIELSYMPKITNELSLETRISYDDKVRLYNSSEDMGGGLDYYEEKFEDKGITGEFILTYAAYENNFLIGTYLNNKNLSVKVLNKQTEISDSLYVVPLERNRAIFLEDSYRGFKDWIFTLGARYETYNQRSTDDDVILPRVAVYKKINDNFYAKYSYNKSALRPTLVQNRGGKINLQHNEDPNSPWAFYEVGADKAQTGESNDFQVGYKDSSLMFRTTLYYNKIENIIVKSPVELVHTIDDKYVQQKEINDNDITQKGIELELKYLYNENFNLYANYAYSDTSFNNENTTYTQEGDVSISTNLIKTDMVKDSDLRMMGTPRNTWNLGINLENSDKLALNIHYRGYSGIDSRSEIVDIKTYSSEHFVDMNFRYKPKDKEFSIYMKNITDNDGWFYTGDGKMMSQIGRELGVRVAIKF